jgi:hypothetical protein
MLAQLTLAVALFVMMPESSPAQVAPALPPPPAQGEEDTPRPSPPPSGAQVETRVAPGAPRTPPAQPAPPVPAPPRKIRGRDLNVQIELTISDQLGNAAPDKRVVSMHIADAAFGRIRSNAGNGVAVLNIDARPEVLPDNERIVVELTIEHNPAPPPESASTKRFSALNEMLTVILQNGKPMVVSQAADPLNDRRITIEVKATISK